MRALNTALKQYAGTEGIVFLDYHALMTNKEGGLDVALSADGVHTTPAGYARMAPLAEAAIADALAAAGAVPSGRTQGTQP